MDEDDDPLCGQKLTTTDQYDTFEEHQYKKQSKASTTTSAIIPGPLPKELFVPVESSIGKQLMKLMGWKEGHGVGPKSTKRKISTSSLRHFEKQPTLVEIEPKNDLKVADFPSPKNDQYGVGFNPFDVAPEFQRYHSQRQKNEPRRNILNFATAVNGPGTSRMDDSAPDNHRMLRGFDDEESDVYSVESKELYDIELGPERKRIKQQITDTEERDNVGTPHRLTHDGSRPLPKFRLSSQPERMNTIDIKLLISRTLKPDPKFRIPKPSHRQLYSQYQYHTEIGGQSSHMNATERGRLLNEKPAPKPSMDQFSKFKEGMTAAMTNRFVSSTSASVPKLENDKTQEKPKARLPVRTEHQWIPERLLSKRFNVPPHSMSGTLNDEHKSNISDNLFSKEIISHLVPPSNGNNDSRPSLPVAFQSSSLSSTIQPPAEVGEGLSLSKLPEIKHAPGNLFQAIFEASSDEEEVEAEMETKNVEISLENKASVSTGTIKMVEAPSTIAATDAMQPQHALVLGTSAPSPFEATNELLPIEHPPIYSPPRSTSRDRKHRSSGKKKSKEHRKRHRSRDGKKKKRSRSREDTSKRHRRSKRDPSSDRKTHHGSKTR